jgi:hypothetical protein
MTDEAPKPFAPLNNDANFSSDTDSSAMFSWDVPATTTLTSPTSSTTPDMIQQNDAPHSCKWDGCRRSFSGISELAKHLHFDHLRNSSPTQSIEPIAIDLSHNRLHSQGVAPDLSCHWGDCSATPLLDSIPGPSNDSRFDAARGILANHLLHDHLGIVIRDPSPVSFQGDEIRVGEIPQPKSSPHSPREFFGIYTCQWQSCEEVFSTCEELTEHIAAIHVGAGKAHYQCFWKGCNRHGDNGFSSKQKICRHLQVWGSFYLSCRHR